MCAGASPNPVVALMLLDTGKGGRLVAVDSRQRVCNGSACDVTDDGVIACRRCYSRTSRYCSILMFAVIFSGCAGYIFVGRGAAHPNE